MSQEIPQLPPDYGERITFKSLEDNDPSFKALLATNGGRLDWKNAQHVMHLTKTTLRKDFGLTIDLPDDRLCPPIPVRYAYIKWLQRLIDTTSPSFDEIYQQKQEVIGIDIGVGASCIYPLLGTKLRPKWSFLGTELDEKNHEYATANVRSNGLQDRIKVIKVSPQADTIFPPLDAVGLNKVDFTMCNPPFYTSASDMHASMEAKEVPPSAVCTGAEVEMITEGGDVGFVLRMVEESRELAEKVRWFTSMFGKLSSARTVVGRLKELGCTNWAVGLLSASGRTRRWVVGWSWGDLKPDMLVARGEGMYKELLPLPTELSFTLHGWQPDFAAAEVDKAMKGLSVAWHWDAKTYSGIVFAKENVWSRSARRKKQKLLAQDSHEMDVDDISDDEIEDNAILAVKISMGSARVLLRWLKGVDYILFDSFCGMLKRHFSDSSKRCS